MDNLKTCPAETSFAEGAPAVRPSAPFSVTEPASDMPFTSPTPSPRDQAFDWLLRTQQAPNDMHLQRELARWQAADEENAKAFRKARQVWRLTEQLTPTTQARWPAVPPVSTEPLPEPPESALVTKLPMPARPVQRRQRLLRMALAGAIAAGFVLAIAPGLTTRFEADLRTAQGERRQVQLPDGSQVFLDSASAIATDFSGNRRDVRLLQGQAFFQVQPDQNRPFEVHARGLDITVTGTAFNVDADGKQPSVAVQHGSVRVAEQHSQTPFAVSLRASQRLTYLPETGQAQLSRLPVTQIAAWRNGQLVADNARLADVVEQLRRYLPGVVLLRDAQLADARITGVYDINNAEVALRAVVQPHGGKVEAYSPFLLVLSRP